MATKIACLFFLAYLNHNHWRRDCAARVEAERNRLVFFDFFGESAGDHLGQGLLFGLGLSGKFCATVTKSCDVIL